MGPASGSRQNASVTALHVFDLDGTLLRDSTVNLELARARGELAELEEMEIAFSRQGLDTRGFALRLRELWHDLTQEVVTAALAESNWIDGITEVCTDIADRGERSMLITMSPNFLADELRHHGFHALHAAAFPPLPFRAALDPAGVLVPEDKVRLVDAELASAGIERTACVAYGDSLSDEPLFRALTRTVAVNASPALTAIATTSYEGGDLRDAYALGRALLEG